MWGEFIDPVDVPDRFWTPRGSGDARRYLRSSGDDSGGSSNVSGSYRPYPFFGDFRGCTWNSQAFFCKKISKYSQNLSILRHMLDNHDFRGLQETHSTAGRARALDQELGEGFASFWSHLTKRSAGIGLIVKQEFLNQFTSNA